MSFHFQRDPDFPLDFGGGQVPTQLGPLVKWALAGVGVILLFVFLSFLRTIYTDWLWFSSLGYSSVFAKILMTRVALFFIGAILFGAMLSLSVYFCTRVSRGPVALPLPAQAIQFLQSVVFWGSVAAVFVLSLIFGSIVASRWEVFLRATSATPFGLTDPLFHRDVGFYVFTLPVYNFVQGWLLGAAIMITLATLGLYFIRFSIRGVPFGFTHGLKVHVSVLAAVILFIIAAGHWLDRWELVLSDRGAVFGAAYADIHARMPGLLILTIIAVASGVLMIVNAYTTGMRLLVGAAALWVVMAIVLGSIWPALMQQFTVTPNEFAREQPYIARNIEFTRMGFGLDRVTDAFYPVEGDVTPGLVQDNMETVSNVRLWDYRPILDVYKQIQLIRPYYEFMDADVDRYTLDGRLRQVMLAAREVAPEKLDARAQTWVNTRLTYTHGMGIAMSPVTEFTPEGRPIFFAKDIPPEGVIPIRAGAPENQPDLLIENPRIYYGENTFDYVIVNTNTAELDYQTADGQEFRNHYAGTGGVQLSSLLRRLAYAWQFGDINILISGAITPESRIQYRRLIQNRVSTVAPFLRLDRDPYIVAADGHLFWIQDAYTTTDQFPYSDPIGGGFNYMRNSVKIVVDAFNGTVRFYVWDDTDPIVRTYANIFPDLFLPKDAMPESLQRHVRYPQDQFSFQATKYLRYHMRDPQNFYNNEDLWAIPNEKFGQGEKLQPVEPYYAIMRLPGEAEEEFVLLLPFTPAQRRNLIGWLAARSDGDNYGKLVAFNFPKDRQVDGPEQIEARIDNDPDISAWFTLRCAEGARCIRGNLLVIPIGTSLLYAEPVYVEARGVPFPELKQVILTTQFRVVMRSSLNEAVAALVGAAAPGPPPGVPAPPGGPPAVSPGAVQGQIEAIEDALQALEEALGAFGEEMQRMREALQQLRDLTGGR